MEASQSPLRPLLLRVEKMVYACHQVVLEEQKQEQEDVEEE